MISGLDSVFAPALVSTGSDGFRAPDISDLFPPIFIFEGTVLGMGRMMMIRLMMYLVLVLCLVLHATWVRLVLGRVRILTEMDFDFCRKNINKEITSQELGHKYSPIIITILFTILFINIAGIIPGFNLAGTAEPGLPLLLAAFSWSVLIYVGIWEIGLGHFVKSSLFPPGVPWVFYILLTPTELVSAFVIQLLTLFIRLLVSIVAGCFPLAPTLSAPNYFLFARLSMLSPLGIFIFMTAFALTLFGILAAFLQIRTFAVLTAVCVNLSIHVHWRTQASRVDQLGG